MSVLFIKLSKAVFATLINKKEVRGLFVALSPQWRIAMRRFYIAALLLTSLILLASSCVSPQPGSDDGIPLGKVDAPAVTKDSSGGAIAVYEVPKSGYGRDFYVQRIDSEGNFLWDEKGILLGSGYTEDGNPWNLRIVGDGSGGAIIAWSAYPSEPDWGLPYNEREVPYTAYLAKVNREGNIIWQRDFPWPESGISISKMVSDNLGGGIGASFSYSRERSQNMVTLLRIDSEGDFRWGEEGVTLYLDGYKESFEMVSDHSGGVISAWRDSRSGILAQRIDSEGNILWPEGGLLVGSPGEGPQLVSDSSGGAIITWMHLLPSEEHEHSYSGTDIYAQRVDAEGNTLWPSGGVAICAGPSNPDSPQIVSNGSGGAIIFFRELTDYIYAQRIDANGDLLWSEEAVLVWKGESTASPGYRVVNSSSGESIVVWGYVSREDHVSEVRAQKIDATGQKLWGADGVLVLKDSKRTSPTTPENGISEDSYGGVILSWSAGNGKAVKSCVQRIDTQGNLLWGEKGLPLNSFSPDTAATPESSEAGLFADPNLERAIREVIAKPTGEIHPEDLQGLSHLYLLDISDLSGIEHCTGLTTLFIYNSQVSDISPLASLSELSRLVLVNCKISDISPLSGLTKLDLLDLSGNQISDIPALSNLSKLAHLNLMDNRIGDVSPLAPLTQLEDLSLKHNEISDISALANLTNLNELNLDYNKITDISPLSGLSKLSILDLSGNQISDISALSNLTKLSRLSLVDNQISDVSPLAPLTQLETLYLSRNEISDISPLASLTNLSYLDLRYNKITDVSPLANLKKLLFLDIRGNPASELSPLSGLTHLELHHD